MRCGWLATCGKIFVLESGRRFSSRPWALKARLAARALCTLSPCVDSADGQRLLFRGGPSLPSLLPESEEEAVLAGDCARAFFICLRIIRVVHRNYSCQGTGAAGQAIAVVHFVLGLGKHWRSCDFVYRRPAVEILVFVQQGGSCLHRSLCAA